MSVENGSAATDTPVLVIVRCADGRHTTSAVSGKTGCGASAYTAAMRLAAKLWPGRSAVASEVPVSASARTDGTSRWRLRLKAIEFQPSGPVEVRVTYSSGAYNTQTVHGQRASSTSSANQAAAALARKLWGDGATERLVRSTGPAASLHMIGLGGSPAADANQPTGTQQ